MKVLVACDESQAVCKAFRERGHEAYSCDIQECSGGHPEWHIKGDALEVLYPVKQWRFISPTDIYGVDFYTQDGRHHFFRGSWDLVIAHPPCTFLTPAGAANIPKHPERIVLGEKAADFFKCFVEYAEKSGKKVCIENPPPMKRFNLPKYTQIVRPWMFGDVNNKPIALWLFGLPELKPTKIVEKQGEMVYWTYKKTGEKKSCSKWYNTDTANHRKHRSKTFPGIAKAMASQWSEV